MRRSRGRPRADRYRAGGEPCGEVVGAHRRRWASAERRGTVRAGHRGTRGRRGGREDLHHVDAELERGHDLGRCHGSGHHDATRVEHAAGEVGQRAGGSTRNSAPASAACSACAAVVTVPAPMWAASPVACDELADDGGCIGRGESHLDARDTAADDRLGRPSSASSGEGARRTARMPVVRARSRRSGMGLLHRAGSSILPVAACNDKLVRRRGCAARPRSVPSTP